MTTEPTLVQSLAGLVAGTTFDSLPDEVVVSVRQRVLDTLGICLAATELETSAAVRRYAVAQGGAGEAHAVGVEEAIPAALAALVNGTLAHSLDYDDTHLPSVLHPSASVIPACLAVAEKVHASGKQVVAAIAAGLEVCVRLGMAGYDAKARTSSFFERGQHATSICGTIASAGSAASLLGADAATIADAMGVAASMASGIIESNRTGGTVKRLHCGWAAHAGVSAAGLAVAGFTGSPTVLEGRFGLFAALLDGHFDQAAITVGLDAEWSVPSIFFKPYPANHFTHAGIDAAIELREKGLVPEDVASIRLGVPGPVVRTIGEPIDLKRRPETGYQAQFSGPYTIAAALIGGGGLGLGLDDFSDALVVEEGRRELMAKVDVVEDPECTNIFPDQFPATLAVRTVGGAELSARVMANRGGPERPLSDEELALKFRENARRALCESTVDLLEEAVWSLVDLPSVTPFITPSAHADLPAGESPRGRGRGRAGTNKG